jgi:hypothetical protein
MGVILWVHQVFQLFFNFKYLSGICAIVVKPSQSEKMAPHSCTGYTKTCAQFEEHSI